MVFANCVGEVKAHPDFLYAVAISDESLGAIGIVAHFPNNNRSKYLIMLDAIKKNPRAPGFKEAIRPHDLDYILQKITPTTVERIKAFFRNLFTKKPAKKKTWRIPKSKKIYPNVFC